MSIPHDGDVVLGLDGQPLVISGSGDKRALIYGIVSMELFIVTVVVALRFVSRRLGRISYWWDDWLIIPSYIIFLMGVAIIYWITRHAYFGVYIGTVTLSKLSLIYKMSFIQEFTPAVNLCTMKLSILFFYWRIFGKGGRNLRRIIIVLMVLIVALAVLNILVDVLQCRPIQALWDRTIEAVCPIDIRTSILIVACTNTITDVFLLALPIGVCLRTHSPWHTKLALAGIFAFGFLTTFFSIYRIVDLTRYDTNDPLVAFNIYYNLTTFELLTLTENACLLVTACLPTLRPVIARSWSKISSLFSKQEDSSGAVEEPGTPNRRGARHRPSPWSFRVWGVDDTQTKEADTVALGREVSSESLDADHNESEKQATRQASEWSLGPEQPQWV